MFLKCDFSAYQIIIISTITVQNCSLYYSLRFIVKKKSSRGILFLVKIIYEFAAHAFEVHVRKYTPFITLIFLVPRDSHRQPQRQR